MIDPNRYGVSFSVKQCRNFQLDPLETLDWLLAQGWRRFRLMSYWDEHETTQGKFDFQELDWQLRKIAKASGVVTLCLGVKQPRWPGYHWPNWAWQAEKSVRDLALLEYVKTVVSRYKHTDTIASWQLENEALLQGFGERIDIDRKRLRAEYQLVKQLDPERPICMSTSNGWGIPIRKPQPDIVGFSYYAVMYQKGSYHKTIQRPWLHRLRRSYIPQPVFIHELQTEPWGPKAIWEMDIPEQDKSMSSQQLAFNISQAQKINAYPIDFWGSEWWYWRSNHGDTSVYDAIVAGMR